MGRVTTIGLDETHPSIARNGSDGAHCGPDADSAAPSPKETAPVSRPMRVTIPKILSQHGAQA